MPFTPRNDLPGNPDVRIFFTGLMLIRARPDSQTCEVFVHRSAPDHQLTIEVRQKQPGKPDLLKMRHVGPLPYALPTLPVPAPPTPAGPPIHGMVIQVRTAPKGVRAFNGVTPSTEGAALDNGTVINFQSTRFHNGRVADVVDPLGGRPSILLNDGVFYTADKTDPGDVIELSRVGSPIGTPPVNLPPIASLIGANIYLDTDDAVLVRWQPQGLPELLELKKPASGISYEIYIINDPLFESTSSQVPRHDEFKEYYKILLATPTPPATADQFPLADQFRLKITPAGPPHKGSTTIPCMPGIIDP